MISSFSVLIKRSTNNTYDMFTCLGRSLPTVTNVSLVFQLHFVRHYVDHHGIHPLEDKVSQCKCLVLINFYYCLFTNCSQILQPLNALLSHSKTKPKEVHWTTEALSTEVKEALAENFFSVSANQALSPFCGRTSLSCFHEPQTAHILSFILLWLILPTTNLSSGFHLSIHLRHQHTQKVVPDNLSRMEANSPQQNIPLPVDLPQTLNSFRYGPFHLHLLWNPYPYKFQTLQFFVTLLLVHLALSFWLSFAVQYFIPFTLSLILEYEPLNTLSLLGMFGLMSCQCSKVQSHTVMPLSTFANPASSIKWLYLSTYLYRPVHSLIWSHSSHQYYSLSCCWLLGFPILVSYL